VVFVEGDVQDRNKKGLSISAQALFIYLKKLQLLD
jgi:hypothetical protein